MKENFKIDIKNLIINNKNKIEIIGILIISIILLIIIIVNVCKIQSKQKYVIYNGKNLNERKYP